MKYAQATFTIFLIIVQNFLFSQSEIFLSNPSFEDFPRHSKQPKGWYDCGFPNESPPDIQPGSFEVVTKPLDGNTYLGLTVRNNDTWEMVAQKLEFPLEANQCYHFGIYLCRSETYISASKNTQGMVNYSTPATLRIWAGNGNCVKTELLATTDEIIHQSWGAYEVHFQPSKTYSHITLEAFYKTPVLFPYNGNILLDHASPITVVDCDTVEIFNPKEEPNLFQTFLSEEIETNDYFQERQNLKIASSMDIRSFIDKNWNQTYFLYKEPGLTPKTKELLQELTGILKADPYLRAEIMVVKGKGALGKKRVESLRTFFRENGLHRGQAYIGQIGATDLRREWDGKSDHLWIYFENRRTPVRYEQPNPKKDEVMKKLPPDRGRPKIKQAKNLIELETMIKRNCRKIIFEEGEDILTQQGIWALEELSINMKRFLKYRLQIVLDKRMEFEDEGLSKALREIMEDVSISESQYEIRYQKKSDEHQKWLGSNDFLKMKLAKTN